MMMTNMNFFEAMNHMESTKCFMVAGGKKYRVQDNVLYVERSSGVFDKCLIAFNLLNDLEWQIYEEPKESKGLWDKNSGIANQKVGLYGPRMSENIWFTREKEARDWYIALTTFMRLKGHPLAVKAKNEVNQYFIRTSYDMTYFYITSEFNITNKIDFLSPVFDKEEDAKQAISDIGKENLLHMFRTFAGIYE